MSSVTPTEVGELVLTCDSERSQTTQRSRRTTTASVMQLSPSESTNSLVPISSQRRLNTHNNNTHNINHHHQQQQPQQRPPARGDSEMTVNDSQHKSIFAKPNNSSRHQQPHPRHAPHARQSSRRHLLQQQPKKGGLLLKSSSSRHRMLLGILAATLLVGIFNLTTFLSTCPITQHALHRLDNNLIGLPVKVLNHNAAGAEWNNNDPVARSLADIVQDANEPKTQEETGPLNYLRNPEAVIKVFKDCAQDPDCYFTYHHVAKTGGTTVEENMFPLFNQDIELTCCHGRMLTKFRDNIEHYCSQKFTSWQVSKNKMVEIVETCRRLRPKSRTVFFVTFREPISTFVSLVHQTCNKNVAKREAHIKRACEVCDFTNETAPTWLEYAQAVEFQIKGAYHTSHQWLNTTDVTSVTIEPNDLNQFWHDFTNTTMHVSNVEENSLCSFRPTSHLVKSLRSAQNIYRRLVVGLRVDPEVILAADIFKFETVEEFGKCRKDPACVQQVISDLNLF